MSEASAMKGNDASTLNTGTATATTHMSLNPSIAAGGSHSMLNAPHVSSHSTSSTTSLTCMV